MQISNFYDFFLKIYLKLDLTVHITLSLYHVALSKTLPFIAEKAPLKQEICFLLTN